MRFQHVLAGAALLFCCAAPAAAQAVKLEFHDGRVNLSAQNASVRAILNEWARLGGTKVINGDRIAGAAVTLELNGVPERQALDIVLRSASGYVAGPREPGTPGQSAYASILILATSNAPRTVAAPPPPPAFNGPQPQIFAPGQQPFVPPQIARQPDPDDDPPADVAPDADAVQGVQGGRPRAPRQFIPPNGGNVNGAVVRPFPTPDFDNDVVPEPPAPAAPSTVPNNPFGVQLGSSRPGVISPVPQQPQQRPQVDPEP
jgi:hypothetical protein